MSSDVERVARYSPNFGFLLQFEPLLVAYGTGAEAAIYTDPNAALVKSRQFIEVLVAELVRRAGTRVAGDKLETRIRALSDAGVITGAMATALHEVRKRGNDAVHGHLDDRSQALDSVNKCFQLGLVLYRAISNDRKPIAFVPPQPPQHMDIDALQRDLDRYKQELAAARLSITGYENLSSAEAAARQQVEQELAQQLADQDVLTAQVAAMTAQIADLETAHAVRLETELKISPADRRAFIDRARRPEPLNEAQARRVIDRMLAEAGWVVQDMSELAPTAAVGVAVREFPFTGGRSDYALYVHGKLVGVIEAKREGTSLTGVELQTSGYARALPKHYSMAAWRRDDPLPFRYESTGAETRFTNQLDPVPRSRQVFSFHRPETIAEWMINADRNSAAPTFRAQVRELPPLLEAGLRPAQIQAINGIESSLAHDRPRTLVQMATGAGKTYTAVTEAYRLLTNTDARRILFLVDRNNLGEQASGEFHNFITLDASRKFDELFNIDRLAGDTVLASTNVVIGTIQRLYMALRGERLPDLDDSSTDDITPEVPVDVVYNPQVPPEAFDLIVVDECHRSIYGQWRAVLEYFDAPIVGLTATPTAQTLGFFDRNLASEYTYEQAVADEARVGLPLVGS